VGVQGKSRINQPPTAARRNPGNPLKVLRSWWHEQEVENSLNSLPLFASDDMKGYPGFY
jgi:hypothetical protein